MKSTIYPNIIFLKNESLTFIGSKWLHAKDLNILSPFHQQIHYYTNVIQKLFTEIKIIKEMLWICQIPASSVVRIYFSEPFYYPSANCCREPLYIQLDFDLTGSIRCCNCLKVIAKFVYTEDQGKSHQELFKTKQRILKSRKQNLRDLITSQKFRGKNLKNNFTPRLHNVNIITLSQNNSLTIPPSKARKWLLTSLRIKEDNL